jgi:voltage-gated potassium channel Kch
MRIQASKGALLLQKSFGTSSPIVGRAPSKDDLNTAVHANARQGLEKQTSYPAVPAVSLPVEEMVQQMSQPKEDQSQQLQRIIFVIGSAAFFLAVIRFIKMLIDHYEASAHLSTPPWYVDRHMLFKICGISLFSWLSFGLVAFTQVLSFNDPPRHLTVIESLYLSAQILTTVGYGDFSPSRPEGQLFLACYIFMGLILVALVVGQMIEFTSAFLEIGINSEDTSETSPAMLVLRRILMLLLAVLIGACFFYVYPGEDKTFWEAFYMSCVTLTTVGFGAIRPQTQGGYLFATFWMLLGVTCAANMVCTIHDSLMKHRREFTGQAMKNELITAMDADGNGQVDKTEFLVFELVRQGLCQKSDIDYVLKRFEELDVDGSGQIGIEDMKSL